ncbi:GH92 family glycosyl hydrolase [Enterococcus sp. AZ109]|uniref:GH92 family glycosyl hydrolase n=1 Tax=Enterococcus sp. AZ109 TaxID=2774634 RepID=UPI003F21894B
MIETIDTRHGTANQHSFSNGNCLPYTGVPFGMNYFAPQTTDQNGSWWFHPADRTFQGYRLTHQPSPWMGDFSHFLMTPFSDELADISLFHAQSSYRPEEATFAPYQIKIEQLRYGINSTLVPSMYGALLDIRFTQQQNGLLLTIPGLKDVQQISEHELHVSLVNFSGCEDENFTFYLTFRFTEPLLSLKKSSKEPDCFLRLDFGAIKQQTVRLGTSFISQEQANLNLAREKELTLPDFLETSKQEWTSYFDRLQVEHTDPNQTQTFYHNLYRVFLFPQTFYEIDENGKKIHYDTFNKKVQSGVLYTNNGFWDTYKTVYPLYSLIAQEKYEEMLEGFLNSYEETGFLPKWLSPDERGLMPGTLIDAVIADAAVKNIRPDLMPRFLEAMKKGATVQSDRENYGRQGTLDYLKYGYVPSNYHESVNHTLDYAYSDFCISQVAQTLGEEKTAQTYAQQALNYQQIFDPTVGLMRAKDAAGAFREDFSPIRWGKDYAEGSAWQSSFAVYQDFQGLIQQIGGREVFTAKLIELCNQTPAFDVAGYGFEIHEMSEMAAIEFGQLAISNQPSFHYPYLFSYAGKPEMAQPLIKNLLTECFSSESNGYPGDEDNGSMAGWYIFNSLGFYPVSPGTGEYVIGMPLIKKAVLTLSNGETLTITASPNQRQQLFLHETKRNHEVHQKLFFTHDDLMTGGKIDYHLGIVPNPQDYTINDLPFSLSK